MPEVAKYIRRVPGFSNSYLVEQADGNLTLVDCGFQPGGEKILSEIAEMGKKPTDVTWIVLTHGHHDHARGAAKIKAATGAKLAVHEAEADYVTQKARYPPPKGGMRAMSSLLGAFVRVSPVDVDLRLKDGGQVGKLIVTHAPGHTPGSIVLIDPGTKSIFSGDTVTTGKEGLSGPNRSFTMDMDEAKKSILRISELEFERVLPGHGDPFVSVESPKRVRELA